MQNIKKKKEKNKEGKSNELTTDVDLTTSFHKLNIKRGKNTVNKLKERNASITHGVTHHNSSIINVSWFMCQSLKSQLIWDEGTKS